MEKQDKTLQQIGRPALYILATTHLPLNSVSPGQEKSVLRTASVHWPWRITLLEDDDEGEVRFNIALTVT